MARRGRSLTVAGVVAAAFLGGALTHLLFDGAAVRAAMQPTVPAAASEGQIMRAYGFVVVDEHGKELARLGLSPKGRVGLTVLDAKDKTRLRVGALEQPAGYGMRAYDAEGVSRIGLADAEDGSGLSMRDSEGMNIIEIGVGRGVRGGDLTLRHPYDGREVWRASRAAAGAYSRPAQP